MCSRAVAGVNEHCQAAVSEKRLQSKQMSKPSTPTNEEIREILAYLKEGTPLESTPQSPVSSYSINNANAQRRQTIADVNVAQTSDDLVDDINLPNIQDDDKLAEEVKEFVISYGCPSLQQQFSSCQHDLEDWLYLELVDDIDNNMFANVTTPELSSILTSDCLQSLNEVNHASLVDHDPKTSYEHKNISSGYKEPCMGDSLLLEPVDDWNNWNEPIYIEKMIHLCNSLNSNNTDYLNEHDNSTSWKVTANCSNSMQGSTGGKTSKVTNKVIPQNNHTPKTRRRVRNNEKLKKLVTTVNDHHKSYVHKLAAVKKSSIMDNCRHPGAVRKNPITPLRKPGLKKYTKSSDSETLQLIVSIPFDCLVTERQFKKYHFKLN